jgi:hypothetical protein
MPYPKSTPAHTKSTVDLGHEPLIRVENRLVSHPSPTCHKPIIRPENKGIRPKSNRHKPKIFVVGRHAVASDPATALTGISPELTIA